MRPFIIHLSQFARQVFCTHRSPSRTIRRHAYCMPFRLPSWLPACISDNPSNVHSLLPVGPTTRRRLLSARRMESVRPARHCLAACSRPAALRLCVSYRPSSFTAFRPPSFAHRRSPTSSPITISRRIVPIRDERTEWQPRSPHPVSLSSTVWPGPPPSISGRGHSGPR